MLNIFSALKFVLVWYFAYQKDRSLYFISFDKGISKFYQVIKKLLTTQYLINDLKNDLKNTVRVY